MDSEYKSWVIPDGWMPSSSSDGIEGHEAICVINLGTSTANMSLTVLFVDREEISVDGLTCAARRTVHYRLDRPEEVNGLEIPFETPYALILESDRSVVVQHTRVDTRSPSLALLTTMATPIEVG